MYKAHENDVWLRAKMLLQQWNSSLAGYVLTRTSLVKPDHMVAKMAESIKVPAGQPGETCGEFCLHQ
jgi:hypothetical protein